MTVGIISIGGLTRLTHSGLSMVDWRPQGSLPPGSEEAWLVEFERYKTYPEYKKHYGNPVVYDGEFTLSDFKFIYFWEWGHRMMGRAIGVAFAAPLAYFAARGWVKGALGKRLGVLLTLGAAQGGIGWWMVKSGLKEGGNETYNDLPRVSAYRLGTHLGMAFALLGGLTYTGLEVLAGRTGGGPSFRAPGHLRALATAAAGIAYLTAVSGSFVAGNEAGLVYNEWPRMGLGLFPSDYWNSKLPALRNMFENSTAAQFNHRTMAYTAVGATTVGWLASRFAQLPAATRLAFTLPLGVSWMQMTLGILTLVNYCPMHLSATHQHGAVLLFLSTVYAMHCARTGRTGKLMRGFRPSAAVAAGLVGLPAATVGTERPLKELLES